MTNVKQIGRYQIVETLGRGGFATVYKVKAIDNTFRKHEVALKVLDPVLTHDADFVARFQQEAEVMEILVHQNICVLFDVGEADGQYFVAMQYIPGQNLRDYMHDNGPLSFDQIASILQQIGAALDYAHAHNVVHRDVKPSNIIYCPEDGHATLTDFGIAKVREATTVFTTSRIVQGTPYYASPEQAESKPLDGRSDLYSLGVVAYELCTGNVPFAADITPSLFYKIVHEEPVLPSQMNQRVAPAIEQVLLKAMSKSPEQRYQSGADIAVAFYKAIQFVQGEWVRTLYAQASAAADKGDDNLAENLLIQLVAVKPDYSCAMSLLGQVRKHRIWTQEYRELVGSLAMLREKATKLQQESPNLPDTENIFILLNRHDGSPKHWYSRRSAWWLPGFLAVIGLTIAIPMASKPFETSLDAFTIIRDVVTGYFIAGISIGAGIVVIAKLLSTWRSQA